MFIIVPTDIADDSPRRGVPIANGLIVATNVLAYFFSVYLPVGPGSSLVSIVGYSFTHAEVGRLLVDRWTLLIVGNAVNRRIGDAYYAIGYFGAVVALGLVARCCTDSWLVGSSGGVFAVVAAMAILMPAARVKFSYAVLFPLTLPLGVLKRPPHWLCWFVRWDTIALRAWLCLMLVPALQFIGLLWWQWNWTNLAHLFGFFCGVALVLLLPDRVSMPNRSRFQF